jgi:hypothetical protein
MSFLRSGDLLNTLHFTIFSAKCPDFVIFIAREDESFNENIRLEAYGGNMVTNVLKEVENNIGNGKIFITWLDGKIQYPGVPDNIKEKIRDYLNGVLKKRIEEKKKNDN